MMLLRSLFFVLSVSALFAQAAQSQETEKSQFCYLPTESNVSYQDVLKLETKSPHRILNYGDDPLQFGELWLPTNPAANGKTPLIILIHGGCWLNAFDIKHTHALSTGLQHAGYAVWSVEYRRTGDEGGGWPGSFNDIVAAVDYVINTTEVELFSEIDRDNIAIVGHSAGGHLALLAGARFKDAPQIHSVIGLAAIVDIQHYAEGKNSCEIATPKFMGGVYNELPKRYDQANPRRQEMHANTTLLHGNLDTIVRPEQAKYLDSAETVMIDGAGHFDMVHPGTASFRALLRHLAKVFP